MHRRGFLLTGAAALACLAGAPAVARAQAPFPVPGRPAGSDDLAFREIFDRWVAEHRPDTATLTVRHGGRPVVALGHGVSADQPGFIASLSKAITAAAIATLVRDGKLSFTAPMREVLAGLFRQYGHPFDPRFENVTVEQLLVHRSGLLGNPDGDPMSQLRRQRLRRGENTVDDRQTLLAEHLRHALGRPPGTEHSYSNAGYIALSAIIEQITRQPYEDYCRAAVFQKLGIASARLHPDWRMLGGSGGWTITGADYLKFLDIFDPKRPFLGDAAKAWIDAARTRWEPVGRRGWYSLGVYTDDAAGRWRVSHGGRLNSRTRDVQGRPIAAVILSHAMRDPNGSGAFLAITPADRPAAAALAELRREVRRAMGALATS